MSRKAESLVWDRARAKGSDLLVLLCIADYTSDDGRYAWPSVQHLAKLTRMSERGAQYVIHRLERKGELLIDWNTEGKRVEYKGREFTPMWFLHIRCVCEWDIYQAEAAERKPAKIAGSRFKAGRRPAERKPGQRNPQRLRISSEPEPAIFAENPATSRTGNPQDHVSHIRKDPSVRDPSVDTDEPARVARHLAFKGARLSVPRFLHEQFADQLGPKGCERFDLLAWYAALDRRDDGPIVGDVLAFIRRAFGEESRRRLGSGGALPSGYGDWSCPHTPTCSHPTRCRNLVAIGRTA